MLSVPGYKEQIEFGVLIYFAYRIDDSEEEVYFSYRQCRKCLTAGLCCYNSC